jgi:hypothetical protein
MTSLVYLHRHEKVTGYFRETFVAALCERRILQISREKGSGHRPSLQPEIGILAVCNVPTGCKPRVGSAILKTFIAKQGRLCQR